MMRARCQSRRIEVRRRRKYPANPHALETRIRVRGVYRCLDPRSSDDFDELRSPPAKQRAQQDTIGTFRKLRSTPHCRETSHAGATRQTHKQCFSLIVSMVRRYDCRKSGSFCPFAERPVARDSSPLLQSGPRVHVEPQNAMPDATLGGHPSDMRGFASALRPDAVIDGCYLKGPRQHCISKEKQGQAIRATRNR